MLSLFNIALPPEKAYLLKFLYPGVAIDSVYYPVVYLSSDQSSHWAGSLLVFVNSKTGINVLSAKGLASLLRQLVYMPESKISRIERMEDADPDTLFKSVALVSMVGTALKDTEDIFKIWEALQLSLRERIIYFLDSELADDRLVDIILKAIAQMYSLENLGHEKRGFAEMLRSLRAGFKAEEFQAIDTTGISMSDLKFHLILLWR
jgi:hypothetical protein